MIKVIKAGLAGTDKRLRDTEIEDTVSNIIDQIASEGDEALRRISTKFDKWTPPMNGAPPAATIAAMVFAGADEGHYRSG